MKINRRIIVIAILFGLISVLLLDNYIKKQNQPVTIAEIPMANVIIAKHTIPQYTRITSDMLEVKKIPTEGVHPEAISQIGDIIGGITRSEIIKGEQVLSSRIVLDETKATLSYRIPEGMRGIALPIGDVSGVGGFISPGDRVDVLVTYSDEDIVTSPATYTTFQNLLVIAVGEETESKDEPLRTPPTTLVLAVTPEQGEVLAFAYLKGELHLTLRSPLDDNRLQLDFYGPRNLGTFRQR